MEEDVSGSEYSEVSADETVTEYDSDEIISEPESKRGAVTKTIKSRETLKRKIAVSKNTTMSEVSVPKDEFKILAQEYKKLKASVDILLCQHNELVAQVRNNETIGKTSRITTDIEASGSRSSRSAPQQQRKESNQQMTIGKSKEISKNTTDDTEASGSQTSGPAPDQPRKEVNQVTKQSNLILNPSKSVKITINPKISNSKPIKPPPLIIYNIQIKSYTNKVRELLNHDNFSFKKLNQNMFQLFVQNNEDFNRVKSALVTNENKFYTFTPIEKKPHSFVIKNLDYSFEEEEVKFAYENEIKTFSHNIEIIKITKFKTKKQILNNKQGFWLIQISPSSSFLSIKKVLNLL